MEYLKGSSKWPRGRVNKPFSEIEARKLSERGTSGLERGGSGDVEVPGLSVEPPGIRV